MNKKSYEVQILVNGKPVREYQKDNLVFVEGKEGTHYEIRVKNNSWSRIKAVIYVDGNSVISDKNDDSGYIINSHSSINIKGFRTSEDTEAEFIFSTKGDSRAQTVKGYAKDCGAIGVKIVQEKIHLYGYNWSNNYNENTYGGYVPSIVKPYSSGILRAIDVSCMCNNVVEESKIESYDFDLGTKMGKDVESKITYTEFEDGATMETFQIHYASRRGLQNMGINLKNEKQAHLPNAFGGFCKRPKNS